MQGNFNHYDVLRIDEMPVVEVHIVPSQAAPGGIGEASTPTVIPAVANAIFAATGSVECIATHSGQCSSPPGTCDPSAGAATCAPWCGSQSPWMCTTSTELANPTSSKQAVASNRIHKGCAGVPAPRWSRFVKRFRTGSKLKIHELHLV